MIRVSTELPWHVESVEGVTEFDVLPESFVEWSSGKSSTYYLDAHCAVAQRHVRYDYVEPTVSIHICHCEGIGPISTRSIGHRWLECSIAVTQ